MPKRVQTLPRQCRLDVGKPKLRYETRAEAKAAAKQHGHDERVYRCGHCGYFHLATKPEQSASGKALKKCEESGEQEGRP